MSEDGHIVEVVQMQCFIVWRWSYFKSGPNAMFLCLEMVILWNVYYMHQNAQHSVDPFKLMFSYTSVSCVLSNVVYILHARTNSTCFNCIKRCSPTGEVCLIYNELLMMSINWWVYIVYLLFFSTLKKANCKKGSKRQFQNI